METIYYNLIKAGRRTIESVPDVVRKEVQALLDTDEKSTD
ncbi:CD1375 family protein [Metabacillus fastidiosus]